MSGFLSLDVASIQCISSVPTILESVASITGMGFVCIASVTADSFTVCALLDRLDFGLQVGDGLDVTTTLCQVVRETARPIVIDDVANDVKYRDHPTPKIYGFQSYISIPIFRGGGEYFGTLFALDRQPCRLTGTGAVKSLTLFAQLISLQIDCTVPVSETQAELLREKETSELREQFIAVLGHDLRTPLGSILTGADLLLRLAPVPQATAVIERMRRSAQRIASLTDDLLDFTRGRMGGGIILNMRYEVDASSAFAEVVDELRGVYPGRNIIARIAEGLQLRCDIRRLSQLLSNLLKNALVHGVADSDITVVIGIEYAILSIEVSNRGPQIPPEVATQLFKPFCRASPDSGGDGLGLGLYIVSEIARSHGGSVELESSADTTTFKFTMLDTGTLERRAVSR